MLNVWEFLQDISVHNTKIRYEKYPPHTYSHTIGDFNIDSIIRTISCATTIVDLDCGIMTSVFTKGIDRLGVLAQFIVQMSNVKSLNNNQLMLVISQYLILNQVFGDGNHRTGMYILEKYSSYSKSEINSIMKITERIHVYSGDLHNDSLWILESENLKPNFAILNIHYATKHFFT
jgi:hypothetical protein